MSIPPDLPTSPLQGTCLGSGERIVVTGATGFLGQHLVRTLLRLFPEARLALLVRQKGRRPAAERIQALAPVAGVTTPGSQEVSRVESFPADLTRTRCGLSDEDYEKVITGTTRVVHAAAAVRFDLPLAEAELINVQGTRNTLALAEEALRAGWLKSFTHVGTAFVAGERCGLALEDDLDVGQSFRNTYEKTKLEAEKLVRARAERIPTVIVRPSIIVGDSQTGITRSFKALYWPLKAYAKWHWRLLPGYPQTVVDIVPVDYVAQAVAHLALDGRAVGNCAHLCAGPTGSATLGELARFAGEFFHQPPPRFVNPRLFVTLLRPLLLATVWGSRRRILQEGPVYRPYFRMQVVFDTKHARELLEPHGLQPPQVKQYLERIFSYCLESDWGRKRLNSMSVGTDNRRPNPTVNNSDKLET